MKNANVNIVEINKMKTRRKHQIGRRQVEKEDEEDFSSTNKRE